MIMLKSKCALQQVMPLDFAPGSLDARSNVEVIVASIFNRDMHIFPTIITAIRMMVPKRQEADNKVVFEF